jgi:hypothetical protein
MKSLVLTTEQQKLRIENVPTRSIFTAKDRAENVIETGVIEINELTTERAFVPLKKTLKR